MSEGKRLPSRTCAVVRSALVSSGQAIWNKAIGDLVDALEPLYRGSPESMNDSDRAAGLEAVLTGLMTAHYGFAELVERREQSGADAGPAGLLADASKRLWEGRGTAKPDEASDALSEVTSLMTSMAERTL